MGGPAMGSWEWLKTTIERKMILFLSGCGLLSVGGK